MKKVITLCILICFIFLPLKSEEFWEKLNNPYPGAIYSILPVSDTEIYAAGNGVYKSTDLGETWQHLDCLGDMRINKLEMDSCGNYYAVIGSQVLRSSDNLYSWIDISPSYYNEMEDFFILDDSTLIISSDYGLYTSCNNGSDWTFAEFEYYLTFQRQGNTNQFYGIFHNYDTIIGEMQGAYIIFKTSNFGNTWDTLCIFNDNDDLFNWVPINNDEFYVIRNTSYCRLRIINKDSVQIKLLPNDFSVENFCISNDKLLIGRSGIQSNSFNDTAGIWMISPDDDIPKRLLFLPIGDLSVNEIREYKEGIFYAATDWGIYKSDDYGLTWTMINLVYSEEIKFTQVRISNNNDMYVSGNGYINFSNDFGHTWSRSNIFQNSFNINTIAISNEGDIFAGLCTYGLWKSSDKGKKWIKTADSLIRNCVQSIISDEKGDIYVYSWNQIIKSTDNGVSWEQYIISPLVDCCSRRSLVNVSKNIFFLIYNCEYLIRSMDGCKTWELSPFPYDTADYEMLNITCDKNNIYVKVRVNECDYDKIYRSTDYGNTWFEISKDLGDRYYSQIFTCPNGELIAASYELGYLQGHSSKGYMYGDSVKGAKLNVYKNDKWYDISYNLLENKPIFDITVDNQGRIVLAQNNGFLQRSTVTYENLVDVSDFVLEPSVCQIYPNPTSGILNLRYKIETSGLVNIFLTDVLGNQTLLKSDFKTTGDYVESFNLSSYPQGIYNIVLQTDKIVSSSKIVILK